MTRAKTGILALVALAALAGWFAACLAGRPADPPRRRRATVDRGGR